MKQNIDTLQGRGVSTADIQGYVNKYKKDASGNYSLSTSVPPQDTTVAKPEATPQYLTDSPTGSLPVIKQLTEFGVGVGTQIGKTGLNLSKFLLKLSSPVAKLLGVDQENKDAQAAVDTISNEIFQKPFQQELDTTAGKIGEVTGEVAPYIATGGATSAVSNAARNAVAEYGAVPRVLAGAAGEALANFGTGYAFTGGNEKKALTQAAVSGFLKLASGTVSEIVNKAELPEKLMTNIFRTSKREELAALGTGAKDSLAKEALERGIKGNTEQIAQTLTTGMSDSEAKIAQEFASRGNPAVVLENPKSVISYITDKANLLEKSGALKEAQGLRASLPAINAETGEISANNALALRRFLDGLRIEKSFLAPTEELSAQQAGLKEMTEEIRHKINAIGGTGGIMKDYAFYIKAMDKLAAYASRTKNADALGLINSFLLGEGIASQNPILGGVAIARKFLKTTGGSTKLAQFLKNLSQSSPGGSGARSVISEMATKLGGE